MATFVMYKHEALDLIGAESTWRKSHHQTQESRSCQTVPVHTTEAEMQAKDVLDNSSQTDTQEQIGQNISLDRDLSDLPGLLDFLRGVEDVVIKELVKNSKSHAFDGFDVNWEDQNEMVSCMFRLQHPDAQERGLQVTSVSWNCTGSVVACGFGRVDDGYWSNEKTYVCTWNLDRRNVNPKRPDVIMDATTPVMCLCFHPLRPSVVAGGLYSGEVVVWDTSHMQDPILAQTGMSADTHREPVYQVNWVPGARRGVFTVLSARSGGRDLLWTVDGAEVKHILNSGYALVRQQLPQSGATSKTRDSTTIGVTSLALSPWGAEPFLVGSEGGLVLKCSFSSETVAAVPPAGESLPLWAPAQSLSHHEGALYTQSTSHPSIGLVQMFDLGRRSLRPAATFDQNTGGQPAYCLEFNPKHTNLLAVGNADGNVNIWQLSAELTGQRAKETAMLEQLANEVTD